MLRVRDDDVFIRPNFEKFKITHETILDFTNVLHVTAIVCDSQWEPSVLGYIKREADRGAIEIQLHGWSHIDYALLTEDEVRSHFTQSFDWLRCTFGVQPTIWYTPWGANTPMLERVSTEFGMKLVDCSNVQQSHKLIEALRSRHRNAYIEKFHAHGEVMCHYWESRSRKSLREVLEALT